MIDFFAGEYEFLSNFYFSPIEYEGIRYETVEHAFQAAKSTEQTVRYKVAAAKTPGQAKRLGRAIDLRTDWEDVKVDIMDTLLRKKFKDPNLQQMLLATNGNILIEGNTWHDNFWGDCRCDRCKGTEGKNHLGKLLMEIRNDLSIMTSEVYSSKEGLIKVVKLIPENYEDVKKLIGKNYSVTLTQERTPNGKYQFTFTERNEILWQYSNEYNNSQKASYIVLDKNNKINIKTEEYIKANYVKENSNVWY